MCKHDTIEFIRKQPTLNPGEEIHLYTCLNCFMTLALTPQKARKQFRPVERNRWSIR